VRVAAPLRLDSLDALEVAAAGGAVVGLWLIYTAARLCGVTPRRALLAMLVCATAPPFLLWPKGELPSGFFLGAVGLAALAWAATLRRPGFPRGLALGACTALAAAVDGAGHLMPLLATAMLAACGRPPVLRLLLFTLALALAHLIGTVLLVAMIEGPLHHGPARLFPASAPWLEVAPLRAVPHELAGEWVLPFLPAAALALVGFLRQGLRLPALAALGIATVWPSLTEAVDGTRVLPVLVAAALLGAAAVPRRLLWLAALLALAFPWVPRAVDALAAALADTDAPRFVVLTIPTVPALSSSPELATAVQLSPAQLTADYDELSATFERAYDIACAQGQVLALSPALVELLRELAPQMPAVQRLLDELLTVRYALVERRSGDDRLVAMVRQ
jgi:hypothetical protein